MSDAGWVEEDWGDVAVRYRVAKALHDEATPFQNMRLVETARYGRMLVLDGFVQTTERDEFVYHEMMTHVPLLSHPAPRRVLVIGGGDGGILREVLRHPTVTRAVLVEIDARVIAFARSHLPVIAGSAFDDPRTEVVIDDGAAYVETTDERFDAVLVDSPDPVGPAEALFSERFYAGIRRVLAEGGVWVRQTGSSFLQPGEAGEAMARARGLFRHRAVYVYAVPTYVGGLFTTLFASDAVDPRAVSEATIRARFAGVAGTCRYYNPGVHAAAFRLPGYVQEGLDDEA